MPAENECRKFVAVPDALPELFAGDEVLEVLLEELLLEGVVPGAGRFFAEAVKPPPPHATVDAIAARRMKAYKCINFKKLLLSFLGNLVGLLTNQLLK